MSRRSVCAAFFREVGSSSVLGSSSASDTRRLHVFTRALDLSQARFPSVKWVENASTLRGCQEISEREIMHDLAASKYQKDITPKRWISDLFQLDPEGRISNYG